MKQLIVTLGLILLGLGIYKMMVTDGNSLYNVTLRTLISMKEAYLCTI